MRGKVLVEKGLEKATRGPKMAENGSEKAHLGRFFAFSTLFSASASVEVAEIAADKASAGRKPPIGNTRDGIAGLPAAEPHAGA